MAAPLHYAGRGCGYLAMREDSNLALAGRRYAMLDVVRQERTQEVCDSELGGMRVPSCMTEELLTPTDPMGTNQGKRACFGAGRLDVRVFYFWHGGFEISLLPVLFLVLDKSSFPTTTGRTRLWMALEANMAQSRAVSGTNTVCTGLRQVLKCSRERASRVPEVCQQVQSDALIGGTRPAHRQM